MRLVTSPAAQEAMSLFIEKTMGYGSHSRMAAMGRPREQSLPKGSVEACRPLTILPV